MHDGWSKLNGKMLPLRRDGIGELEREVALPSRRRVLSKRCRTGMSIRSSNIVAMAISTTPTSSVSARARSS
jgi:hypothetical protein